MSGVAICRRSQCNTEKVERMDALGRITWVCRPCARNRRGLCRDCPGRLTSARAFRCDPCTLRHRRQVGLARYHRYRRDPVQNARLQRTARRRYQEHPEYHAIRMMYMQLLRLAFPEQYRPAKTDADRLYQRTWARGKRATDPAWRQRQNRKRRRRSIARGVIAAVTYRPRPYRPRLDAGGRLPLHAMSDPRSQPTVAEVAA